MSTNTKAKVEVKGAATEENIRGGAGRGAQATVDAHTALLNAQTQGKFVLFNIPIAERVADGPVMRGLVEIEEDEQREPIKISVAGWAKVARETGTEYLSLKVANTEGEGRQVGPFYGRLFKNAMKTRSGEVRVRYFGFIEDAEKVGDLDGKGLYQRNWQLAIRAKRQLSRDAKTVYIAGSLSPAQDVQRNSGDIAF